MTKCRLTMTLASMCLLANAASAADRVPAAPIPPQILTAKTVFISNASDDCIALKFWAPNASSGCTRDIFYNEVYAALRSAGRYQVTLNPQDADLVLELSLGSSWIPGESTPGIPGRNKPDSYYKLAIIDAKTHFTLWSFFEHVEPAVLEANQKKNHMAARAQIVTDFKALTTPAEKP